MKKDLNEQVSRIKEMMNLPTENEGEITEAGFSKVAQTLRGIVPNIKTIAIITAENPQGKEYPSNINKQRNNELKKDIAGGNTRLGGYLRSGFYGYRQIKGQYGNLENPFIINNISREEAVRLGEKYDQDTIIFAEVRQQPEGEGVEMFFELVKTTGEEKNQTVGTQRVFITLGKEGESEPQDFYSEVKGRKFIIPFYGIEDMLKTKLKDTENLYKYEKRSRNFDDAKWVGGKAEPTSTELTPSSEEDWDEYHGTKNITEQLNKIVDEMVQAQGSKAYNCRGRYATLLRKYGISIND